MSQQSLESQAALADDPDEAIRVWHHHLDGSEIEQIRDHVDFKPSKIAAVLASAPPDRIGIDLRYRTGQRAVRIEQSGRDALLGPDGLPRPIVMFVPHSITAAAFRIGVAGIEIELRDDADYDVSLSPTLARDIDMRDAFALYEGGAPTWEIDARGGICHYAGRHAKTLREVDWAIAARMATRKVLTPPDPEPMM